MSVRSVDGEAVPLVGDQPGALVPTPTPEPYATHDSKSLAGTKIYDTHHGVKRHVPLVESTKTDLHRATEDSDPARLADLLETDLVAKIDHQNWEGFTALHYAVMMSTTGQNYGRGDPDRIACCKLLIDAGADLNVPGQWAQAPLYLATISHYPAVECVGYLVEARADICQTDEYGGTAIHGAVYGTHVQTLKGLMQHPDFETAKAVVNHDKKTALDLAIEIYDRQKKKVESGRLERAPHACIHARASSRAWHAHATCAQVELAPCHCEVRMLLETGKGLDGPEGAVRDLPAASKKQSAAA